MAGPLDLDGDDVRTLLVELGRRLDERGERGELYVVGGAALALVYDRRRTTVDIDAVLKPAETIRAVAAEMAVEHGLPSDWLNSAAAAFVPGGDRPTVHLEVPGLVVAVASPEHLVAMKMAAYRPGQDQLDLELLFAELGITTAAQAADLALRIYGEHTVVLPDRPELLLSAQAVLDRMDRRPGL